MTHLARLAATSLMLLASPLAAQPAYREVPDDALTPGVAASTNEAEVCGRAPDGKTYSQEHRRTTEAMKRDAFRRYGLSYPPPGGRQDWEVDHRLDLADGGADDPRNLWPQPSVKLGVTWGREQKDRLELYAWQQVCVRHTVPLAAAQSWFLPPNDWRAEYCQKIGGAPCAKN